MNQRFLKKEVQIHKRLTDLEDLCHIKTTFCCAKMRLLSAASSVDLMLFFTACVAVDRACIGSLA